MIALVEGAERQKTPNEIALNILLAGLTIIFLLAVVTLQPFAIYSGAPQTVFVLVSLLVCLIPTTIGGLLSAIGIAGMDRLVQRNVLAMSGRAVEAAGDVHTLLLDKTGTITFGNRQATSSVRRPASPRRRWPTRRSWPRSPTRRRKGAQSSSWPSRSTASAGRELASHEAAFIPVHGADADVGRGSRRPAHPQGGGRRGGTLPHRTGILDAPELRSRWIASRATGGLRSSSPKGRARWASCT
jgi:K+-transporting ATPase ATPase B chain